MKTKPILNLRSRHVFLIFLFFALSTSNLANAQCTAEFTYSKKLYRCAPNTKCLEEDNITVTFKADYPDYQTYSWDFGDGQTGQGKSVEHKYFKPGEYKVTLKTFNPDIPYGEIVLHAICQKTLTKIITIEAVLTKPVVQPTCDIKLTKDLIGNVFTYSDNRPNLYKPSVYEVYNYWSFGDGTSSDRASGNHSYKKPGKYLVKYHTKVFNNMMGQSDYVCQAEMYDSLLNSFIPCYYQELCSKSDSFWVETTDCKLNPVLSVDGNTLSYNHGRVYPAVEGRIIQDINYWTFGDGTSASESYPTRPTQENESNMSNGKHTYKKPGKYLVTLHTGSFTNPLLGNMEGKAVCLAFSYDSLLRTYIPCYYGEICRGKYSFWIEIKGDSLPDPLCDVDLQVEQYGQTIKGTVIEDHYLAIYGKDYLWNFGDGSDTSGYSVSHEYKKPGKYMVSLTTVTYSFPLKEVCRATKTQWVEIKNLIMNLSPNPMDNSGTISIENASRPVQFSIYNHAGQLMKSYEGLNNGKLDFPTHDLPIGIYLYTVTSGGELIKKDKFSVAR